MIYQGSKAKLRKEILPILQNCIDTHKIKGYVEPFVGGANIIDHIQNTVRIGTDSNYELIELLKYMRDNPSLKGFPEECSFEHYAEVREQRKLKTDKYPAWYIAGIGYFASYGGRYFDGGYGRDSKGGRSIYNVRLAHARKQAPLLKDITFNVLDYHYYDSYTDYVFYLDPPYKGTKTYNGKSGFDYEDFYDFVRRLSKRNYVFVSEYYMPEDFKCIWSKERKVLQKSDREQSDTAVEKLYTIGLTAN
jgi:DNA adenine methylase